MEGVSRRVRVSGKELLQGPGHGATRTQLERTSYGILLLIVDQEVAAETTAGTGSL